MEALTMILARELRGRDVTVNAVAPGPTAAELFLDGEDEQVITALAAQPPLERLEYRDGRGLETASDVGVHEFAGPLVSPVLSARGEQFEALEAEYEAAQRSPGTGHLPAAGPPVTR